MLIGHKGTLFRSSAISAGIQFNYLKQQYILWISAYAEMAPVNIKLGIFKGDEYITPILREVKLQELEVFHRRKAQLYDANSSLLGGGGLYCYHMTNSSVAFEAWKEEPSIVTYDKNGRDDFWVSTSNMPAIWHMCPIVVALAPKDANGQYIIRDKRSL